MSNGGEGSLALTVLRPEFRANREKYREFAYFKSESSPLYPLPQ